MAAVRMLTSPPLSLSFSFFLFFILFLSLSYVVVSDDEEDSLLDLKESLQNTTVLESWKKGSKPCDKGENWKGVTCNNGYVTRLVLKNHGLSGSIDVFALAKLVRLKILIFDNNSFSGKIPEFGRITSLKYLSLQYNQFSEEIPPDFFSKTTSLKKIFLSHNKFSGRIPDSLTKLEHIMEIRLQFNEFSGPVPLFPQTSIMQIDFSHNKLEGEIPEGMIKFGKRAFLENPGLCSSKFGKECKSKDEKGDKGKVDAEKDKGSYTLWIILGVVTVLLLLLLLSKFKRKEEIVDVRLKENLDEVVQVPPSTTNKRSMSSNRLGKDSSMRASRRGSRNDRSGGELVIINEDKGIFGLPDLMKAAAEILGNGSLGSAYKAAMSNGVCVVVKRLREMNKLSKEVFDSEMRQLGNLKHPNILPPLAYHYRKEEKLFVSEFVPKGSLLYLLHGDRGISHAQLNWPTRLKIIKGVAQGMGYLHTEFASYELPHGNLKSSNILLTQDNEPLLTDYAFYPLINQTHIVQSLFAFKSPEAILYQQVSPKSDVYCLGIIILEVLTGKFPSQYLSNHKGGTDVVQWAKSALSERRALELIDPEIARATNSLGQMERLLHIGAVCTDSNHDTRIDMREAIRRIEEIQV